MGARFFDPEAATWRQLARPLRTMCRIQYRRARPEDYASIIRLQRADYIGNLTEEERREGFLSAEFSLEQVAAIATDLGIAVVTVGDEIAGCLCAFRREFDHGSPVVAKMLEAYEQARFEAKPLSAFNSYIYGPVCIAREYRRRGLLRGLYEFQKRDLAGRFEVGVALVSHDNPHSMQAHIGGLGMTEAGKFELNGNLFAILAFRL
jgi:predicted GNAT superfamily acetyltransferase